MSLCSSRFIRSLLVAGLFIVVGCERQQEEAPTPSNSGALTDAEFEELRRSSEQGDNEAMYRLASNYLFIVQDEEQAWLWMEKSAEAGNLDARHAFLGYLEHRDPADKERAKLLRQKWANAKSGVNADLNSTSGEH